MSLTGNAQGGYNLRGKLNGLKTIHGYSAYEVAVINGFSGTEEEWLESLKGDKGDKGDKGNFENLTDEQKEQLRGYPGEKGDKGDQGDKGNGIQNMMWLNNGNVYEGDRVVARKYKLFITVDDGRTFEFAVEGGADGKTGPEGDGISNISFEKETEEGRLYYAQVGMKLYPILIPRGPAGADGKTPVKGTDYWTPTDKAEIVEEVLAEVPSGGASSWNDLTDKPFSESFGDTLTWDHDIEGRESTLSDMLHKVSDVVLTIEDFANGCAITRDGGSIDLPAEHAVVENGALLVVSDPSDLYNALPYVMSVDENAAVQFGCSAGTYFLYFDLSALGGDLVTFDSLTIPGYTGFNSVKTIDEKFIPDTIQRTITGTPGDFVVIGEDGKATTGEPPAGGGETWRLIADIELTEEVNGVEITQDMDGKAIALKKFYVLLTSTVPTGTAFTTIKTVVNTYWGSPMGDFTRGHTISNNFQNNETTYTRYFYTYAEFIPGVGCLAWTGGGRNLYNQATNMQQMLRGYTPLYLDSAINRLLVTPNDGGAVIGGVGSKVMIWGVDA